MGYYLEENGDGMQYGAVRRNGARLSGAVGVHTTEWLTDFSGPDQNAENVAAFMARRFTTQGDYGSYHIVSDYDTIVDLVRADHEAWHDIFTNNHSLSVSMSLQAARWMELTPERRAQIVRMGAKAAYLKCREAVRMGLLADFPPARRITGAQAIAGTHAGFYGHGETNPGTRYDPGSNFDWDLFLNTYAALVASNGTDVAGSIEEDDMAFTDWPAEDQNALVSRVAKSVVSELLNYDGTSRTDRSFYALNIDAGLHSVQANGKLDRVLQLLENMPRSVQGYKGADEQPDGSDVYRKINDLVAVVVGGVPPEQTVTFSRSGAVQEAAVAAGLRKPEPIEDAGEVKK